MTDQEQELTTMKSPKKSAKKVTIKDLPAGKKAKSVKGGPIFMNYGKVSTKI